jgi:hypothetical protein
MHLTFQVRKWSRTYPLSGHQKHVAGRRSSAASCIAVMWLVDVGCASLNVLCASYRVQNNRCLFPCTTWTDWSETRYSLWGRKRIVIWNVLQIVQCAIHFIVHQIKYLITWLLSGGRCTEETAELNAECISVWDVQYTKVSVPFFTLIVCLISLSRVPCSGKREVFVQIMRDVFITLMYLAPHYFKPEIVFL